MFLLCKESLLRASLLASVEQDNSPINPLLPCPHPCMEPMV
ncbi:MAG: hypothetical protein ACPIOQ_48515 [Promethearchaeia archaeon]